MKVDLFRLQWGFFFSRLSSFYKPFLSPTLSNFGLPTAEIARCLGNIIETGTFVKFCVCVYIWQVIPLTYLYLTYRIGVGFG